jgi:signal peptidase I
MRMQVRRSGLPVGESTTGGIRSAAEMGPAGMMQVRRSGLPVGESTTGGIRSAAEMGPAGMMQLDPGTQTVLRKPQRIDSQGSIPWLLNERFEVLLLLADSERTLDFAGYDRLARQSVVVRIFKDSLVSDPEVRQLLRESLAKLHSLKHDALVPIIDWGRCERTGFAPVYFVITRPLDSPTLRRLVHDRGPMPTNAANATALAIEDLLRDLFWEGLAPLTIEPESIRFTPNRGIQVDPVDVVLDIVCRTNTSLSPEVGEVGELSDAAEARVQPVIPVPRVTAEPIDAIPKRKKPRRLRLPVVSAALLTMSWLSLAPPELGGQFTFTVVAGKSMEPAFHTGDLVVLRRSNRYRAGDVVTYSVPEDPYRSFNVVHRIRTELADGSFLMRGDNRDGDDPWIVSAPDIRGKQILLIAKAGFVLVFLSSPIGFALAFGVMVTIWFWGSPMLDRREP